MKFKSFLRFFQKRSASPSRSKARPAARRRPLDLEMLETRICPVNDAPFIVSATPAPNSPPTANAQPTISITYSENVVAVNPANTNDATNPNNYLLFASSGAAITINSVVYNNATFTVTLSYNSAKPLPVDQYTLFVKGDHIFDTDDGLPVAQPGQLAVVNGGTNTVSLINERVDPTNPPDTRLGRLDSVSNYVVPNSPVPSEPSDVQLADLNADGVPDMILTDRANNDILIYQGIPGRSPNGGGFRTTPIRLGVSGIAPTSVVVADLSGDGLPDLATANFTSNDVSVLLNTTVGTTLTFASPQVYKVGKVTQGNPNPTPNPISITAGNLGGGFGLDLAVANNHVDSISGSPGNPGVDNVFTVTVLFNNLGFSAAPTIRHFQVQGVNSPTSIAAGDIITDGDSGGFDDLVVGGASGVEVMRNRASNVQFLNETRQNNLDNSGPRVLDGSEPKGLAGNQVIGGVQLTGVATNKVAVGHLFGSGRFDVAATQSRGPNVNGQIMTFRNLDGLGSSAPFSFSTATFNAGLNPVGIKIVDGYLPNPRPTQPGRPALTDLNNDGKPDILVTNDVVRGTVTVLLNQSAGAVASFVPSANSPFSVDSYPVSVAAEESPLLDAAGNQTSTGVPNEMVTANFGPPTLANPVPNFPIGNATVNDASFLMSTLADGTQDGNFIVSTDIDLSGSGANNPVDVVSGDLNGDGLRDLVMVQDTLTSNGTIQIFLGQPGGTFDTTPSPIAVGVGPVRAYIAHIRTGPTAFFPNGAPVNDILVVNELDDPSGIGTFTGDVQVLRNNANNATPPGGAVSFTPLVPAVTAAPGAPGFPSPMQDPTSLVVADFDRDSNLNGTGTNPLRVGAADLAVAHIGQGGGGAGVSFFLGNGDGTFRYQGEFGSGINAADIVTSDFTGNFNLATDAMGNPIIDPQTGQPMPTATSALDLAVLDDRQQTVVDLLQGKRVVNANGTITFTFMQVKVNPAGLNPNPSNNLDNLARLVTADFNRDGLPDVAVTNYTPGAVFPAVQTPGTSSVSVLLNAASNGFGAPITTKVVGANGIYSAGQIKSIFVTDTNRDFYPDLVVTTGVATDSTSAFGNPVATNNNVYTLAGVGDGTFGQVQFYAAGGSTIGLPTQPPPTPNAPSGTPPSFGAVVSDPLIQVTTFQTTGTLVNPDLIGNGSFETLDLSGENGNLNAWQAFDQRNSNGRWQVGTSNQLGLPVSPLSASPMGAAPPEGNYAAVLDQDDRHVIGGVGGFGGLTGAASDYAGSHALYQQITLSPNAISVKLSLQLYIDNTDAGRYSNTAQDPSLDYNRFNTSGQLQPDQQVRIDIVDPQYNVDPATGVLRTNSSFQNGTPAAVLKSIYLTKPATTFGLNSLKLTYMDLRALLISEGLTPAQADARLDLTSLIDRSKDRNLLIRISEANNQGKLVVGVDEVHVTELYNDTEVPTIGGLSVRNPGFGGPQGSGGRTTDFQVVGQVADDGGPRNIKKITFDLDNAARTDPNTGIPLRDASGNLIPDFTRGLPVNPAISFKQLDAQGNFSFDLTPDLILPGSHTIPVQIIDGAGNVTVTEISFFAQGPSTTNWSAYGPGPITTGGVDDAGSLNYTTVSGRVTVTVVDQVDSTGNTYYIGSANGGVWKTTDGGSDWTPLLTFPRRPNIDPTSGVVLPLNKDGTNYIEDAQGLTLPVPVGNMAIVPNDHNTIYVALGVADLAFDSRPGSGILKTNDGGHTWVLLGQYNPKTGLYDNVNNYFGGARITKVAVDDNVSLGFNGRVYVTVAQGGRFGPGVYRSDDGGLTWLPEIRAIPVTLTSPTNQGGAILPTGTVLPANMLLPGGTTQLNTTGIRAVPSGTDFVVDRFSADDEDLWLGLGNMGLVDQNALAGGTLALGNAAGVWRSTDHGDHWQLVIGGNHSLPGGPNNPDPGNAIGADEANPNGINVGRITLAQPTGRAADESMFYVMVASATPFNNLFDAGSTRGSFVPDAAGNHDPWGLFTTLDNGLNWTHVMVRQSFLDVTDPDFINIDFTGQTGNFHGPDTNTMGSYVGTMIVDPTNPFVVYFGGSDMGLGNGPSDHRTFHGLLRIDTRDLELVTGDNLQKEFNADLDEGPEGEDGPSPADLSGEEPYMTSSDPYLGEGAFWYDLEQDTAGPPSFTSNVPAVVHSLAMDAQGRLLMGTDRGFWRGVAHGFAYDYGNENSIVKGFDKAPIDPGPRYGVINLDPFTGINGNLQISDQISVSIDPTNSHTIYSSQADGGFAVTTSPFSQLNHASIGLTYNAGQIIASNIDPRFDPTQPPDNPQGTLLHPTQVFRTNADLFRPTFPFVDRSDVAGQLNSFNFIDNTINQGAIAARFRPLALNPNRVGEVKLLPPQNVVPQLNYYIEALYGNSSLYETDSGESPNGSPNFDVIAGQGLQAGDTINAVAFAPSNPDAFYIGTTKGKVFRTLNDGSDGFLSLNTSTGLPGLKINAVRVDPNNERIAYALIDGFNTGLGHVFVTKDAGATWTRMDAGLADAPAYSMAIDSRTEQLFVGTERGVFFFNTATGMWTRFGQGLPTAPIYGIDLNERLDQIAVATLGFGTYVLSTSIKGPTLAPSYSLGQITPSDGQFTPFPAVQELAPQFQSGQTVPLPDGSNSAIQHSLDTPVKPTIEVQSFVPAAISASITMVSLTSNVATLTTSGPQNGFMIGDQVTVTGLSAANAFFKGTFQITGATPTTFSYALVHADVPPTVDSGTAVDVPRTVIAPAAVLNAAVTVPDDFPIYGIRVRTDITYPNDVDLRLALVFTPANGNPTITIPLATHRGGEGSLANFQSTVFDDRATVPIRDGDAPFNSQSDPSDPLGTTQLAFLPEQSMIAVLRNMDARGMWQLRITNDAAAPATPSNTGTLNRWDLVLEKAPIAFSEATLTFNKPIDPRTFSTADIIMFNGPDGPIDPSTVTITDLGAGRTPFSDLIFHNQYLLSFPNQTRNGTYQIAFDPFITDFVERNGDLQLANVDGSGPVAGAFPPDGTGEIIPQENLVASQNGIQPDVNQDQNGTGLPSINSNLGLPLNDIVHTFAVDTGDNAQFISGLYHDLFIRTGGVTDTEGFVTLNSQITPARDVALYQTALGFFTGSPQATDDPQEARKNLISGFFKDPVGSRSPLPIGNLLGRTIDANGLTFFTILLQRGVTPEQILTIIAQTGEYFNSVNSIPPGDPAFVPGRSRDSNFINKLYTDILGRPVDANGLTNFNNITEVGPRTNIISAVDHGGEYHQDLVNHYFSTLLGHAADPGALSFFGGELNQGVRDETVLSQIIGGDEYFLNPAKGNGDNATWLNSAYNDILGRPADSNALGFFGPRLAAGMSRQSIALMLLNSDEYRSILLTGKTPGTPGTAVNASSGKAFFSDFLGRAPSQAEINFFTGVLRVAPDETVVSSIVASDEYFRLHDGDNPGLPPQTTLDANWLNGAFTDLLNRGADAGAQNAFLPTLTSDEMKGRNSFAQVLPTTPEYRTHVTTLVYQKYLGRAPVAGEINIWQPFLQQPPSGAPLANADEQFIAHILASNEYFQKNGNSAQTWVPAVFQDVLSRAPNAVELARVLSGVLNGFQGVRSNAALELELATPEYKKDLTLQFYQRFLRRAPLLPTNPDPFHIGSNTGVTNARDELDPTVAALQSLTDQQVIVILMSSQEYFLSQAVLGSGVGKNNAFVKQAIKDLLERDASASELSIFTTYLNAQPNNPGTQQAARVQVLATLMASREYHVLQIAKLYSQYFGRSTRDDLNVNGIPDIKEDLGVIYWAGRLNTGIVSPGGAGPAGPHDLTIEQIQALLLGSTEYFQRPHYFP